jgi:hypothetical protein
VIQYVGSVKDGAYNHVGLSVCLYACHTHTHTHTQAYASDLTAFNITFILHADAPVRALSLTNTHKQAYASDPTTFNVAGLSDALTQLQVECVL